MGVFLFLLLFLVLILLFFAAKGSQKRVEIRGLDGSSLIFTEAGVTYAGGTGVKFISSSSIKKLSIEKDGDIFKIYISDGVEEIVVPVAPQEVKKLFRAQGGGTFEPLFPYIPTLAGIAGALLIADALAHRPVIVEKAEESSEPQGDEEEPIREFDLGNPPESEFDYFDTGEWFDE